MVTDTIKRQKLLEEGIDPDLAEEVESQPLPDQQNPTVNPTAEVIQVKPKGMLGKAWDAANYQFVPPETMREGIFGTARNIIFGDTGMPSVKETIDALGPENTPRYLRAAGEAEKGISSVASSLVTPLGIASAGVGSILKAAQVSPQIISTIGRIIAGGFAVPAAKHTLEAAPEVYKAATGEDPISAISPAIETVGSALIAGLAGKQALTKANIPANPLANIRARHVASEPLVDTTTSPTGSNVVEPVPSGSQSLALSTGAGIIPGTIKTKSFESSPYITEKGGLDALDREAKAKEAEEKMIKKAEYEEKKSQRAANRLAAVFKAQDKAVAEHFDMTPEQFASIHDEGKAELRDLYKTQTEQQAAVKEPVVEKSKIKDQPASNLQPVPFEEQRLAAEARPAQPRVREGIYSEDEPLKQKRDELIQEEANKAQELKDAVNKANAETDPTKRVALFSNVDRIRSEFRSVMKRTDSITSGEKNPSINQEGPSLQDVASKRQEPLVKAAEEQKVPLTISKAWDSAFKELAKQRNVTIDSSGRVFKSDGTEVSGEAFVRDGIKDVLAKINRVKGDIATYPHELFHPFLRDLMDRGTSAEKALVSRAFKVLEKSPSYLEWKAARESEGKNATTEEYLTTLTGEDTVRRALQLDKKGSFKNWMSDFWSHVKQKFGKGTEADFARLMSRKLTTDLPFDQTFGMKGGDVTNANQEENKRQEVLGSKLSEGDEFGKSSSDTSKFTPEDVDTYKNLKSQMQDMIEKDDFSSPEFRNTWQKLENVKNKYGGKSLETSESPIDKMRQVVDKTPEATTTPATIEPNVGTRVNEDAMRRRGNKYSEGEGLASKKKEDFLIPTGEDIIKKTKFPSGVRLMGSEIRNRIKNIVTPTEYETYKDAGLEEFLKSDRTTKEVEKWIDDNVGGVEIRKFTNQKEKLSPKAEEFAELTHNWYDAIPDKATASVDAFLREYRIDKDSADTSSWLNQAVDDMNLEGSSRGGDFRRNALRYAELSQEPPRGWNSVGGRSNWQSIAPKVEGEMPGYVELAVMRPTKVRDRDLPAEQRTGASDVKFPSSHNFPPNTLGFVRGYMETQWVNKKTGERISGSDNRAFDADNWDEKKVFHIIEMQSDWAQKVRDYSKGEGIVKGPGSQTDILLKDWERLALKAAIKHAREQGADAIALSDAETAMMTEGHDRYAQQRIANARMAGLDVGTGIEQEKGMRLHYDVLGPKILSDLTGVKGEKVEFGEHKMALTEPMAQQGGSEFGKIRKDLIFKTSSGEPKTTVSANVFPLKNVENRSPNLFGKRYSEGEPLYSDEPTKLRLVTESPLPNESSLPKDVAELPKDSTPEIEAQSAPWGLKFLAPRFARIGVEIPTSTGNYVSQQLTRFSAWMNRMEGQIGGKQLQLIRQHKLTEPEAQTVVKYLWQMDDAGKSSIKLSSKLDNFIQNYTTLIRQPRELQNELGLKVKEGGDFRVGGIKKEGYFPNMLDPQVAYEWAKNPTSEASKSYDKLYLNHLTKRGVDLKEAQETLNGYKAAIGYQARPEVEFGALRKAEGKGLPYELIDKNLAHVMSRYGRRSARDLAFFKYIQDDPKMLKALNMHDQYGQRVDTEKYPEIDNIGSNNYVQKAMRSVFNIESAQFNEHVSAAARLTGNVVMGVGTAAKNLISMPTFIAPYLKISQLPKFVEAFTKLNETKARAYENNAIRASFADFDTAGDFSIHPNPTIRRLAQASYILRKYQGRELSDKMEGWYNYTLGELLAHDNLASAKTGDKTAQSFMKRFGDTVDGGVERLFKPDEKVTADDIGTIAKRFTDAVRGTYSAEGLPSFAIEGPMAPFTALSRFSIEKSNTIWKDVVLPMKSGNISPLLKLTFAGLLTGAAIEKLNELLTNKRGVDPTIKETIESGSKEALVAKVIGLLQLSSTAGIVTDAAKSGMNLFQRKDIKYNNPLSFPLYSMTIDVLGKNLSDAVEAIRDGDSILDVLPSFIQAIATQSNQTYRYLDANVFHPEEAKRKEKFRDLRAFKELEGENVPSSGELPNVIEGKQLKKFKRTSDMTEAAQLLPSLLDKAFEKADGSYEKFKKEIEKIQRNSYQTMPSPNNKPPESFLRYMMFLEKTQGRDAANERLKDYLLQNAANKVKSQAVSLKE